MRTIVAGCRWVDYYPIVEKIIMDSGFLPDISEIVSGAAAGVDWLGEQFAKEHGIPVKRFPADWIRYGKSAGPIRNVEMAAYADALIAVWDGQSRGTGNMIEVARKKGLKVYVGRM